MKISTRHRVAAGATAVLASGASLASLALPDPRAFTRVVIASPESLGAHIGSLETWLRYLGAEHTIVLFAAFVSFGVAVVAWYELLALLTWPRLAPGITRPTELQTEVDHD